MRTVLLLVLLLFPAQASADTIFVTTHRSQADLLVFVTTHGGTPIWRAPRRSAALVRGG